MVEIIVLVTGGMDPIHKGHIQYLKCAKNYGEKLFVGINSDEWLTKKKGRSFMSWQDRSAIINELSCVYRTINFDDSDGTACNAIQVLLDTTTADIIFANGGDRTSSNIPELEKFKDNPRVSFKFGVGGEHKLNSSSKLLDEWTTSRTVRDWGYWRVLNDNSTTKVKELTILPGKSLSMQRHFHRSEHWYILKGGCTLTQGLTLDWVTANYYGQHESIIIPTNNWHQAKNDGNYPCHILEVQYGSKCIEEDIERHSIE
jgi:cytidyltransferase-like protein